MPSETDGPLLRKRPPVVYEPSLELIGSRVLDASEESKLGKQTPARSLFVQGVQRTRPRRRRPKADLYPGRKGNLIDIDRSIDAVDLDRDGHIECSRSRR
jgi:hypothetical protein